MKVFLIMTASNSDCIFDAIETLKLALIKLETLRLNSLDLALKKSPPNFLRCWVGEMSCIASRHHCHSCV